MTAAEPTRADVCCVAVAECFRGDGEILANPIGTIPMIGGRLARATFEPDLVMTDGFALLVAGPHPVGESAQAGAPKVVEGWNPYRAMFDVVWSGRRHVMMGATQIDRHGNQNIWAIGAKPLPKVQLLGPRGAPGNTVNDPTSYWVPNHSPRVFVESVDYVSGVGHDRAAGAGPAATRHHDLRRVVTNLGVLDFGGPGGTMSVVTRHPGVTTDDLAEATGFELAWPDGGPGAVPETRRPTPDELELIGEVLDPDGLRFAEVPS